MRYRMDLRDADRMLTKLQEEYEIWASECLVDKGGYSNTGLIKHAGVDRAEEIECRKRSDFPAKGVSGPITQSLFHLTGDEFIESEAGSKKLLIFIRPYDIHAQHRQEKIYLINGGYEDIYYKRMSEKVRIVMMECDEGWDTCFCASMGTNKTDDYSMAVRFGEDGSESQVKDHAFTSYFESMEGCSFEPQFVEKNELTPITSETPDKEIPTRLKEHPMWRQFDGRCISCGTCTAAYSTCTYFTTTDIIYNEDRNVREHKRTPVSCQVKGFTDMASGIGLRNRAGDRVCYKVFRRSHDYKVRFRDYYMYVGCGRCMNRCPEYISIVVTVNKVAGAIEEIEAGRQAQEKGCSHE